MFSAKTYTAREGLEVLNCHRLPARLNTTETAIVLGFQEHDIAVLVGVRLLTPLGKPVSNAQKYFAAVEISALSNDRGWLDRATRAISAHWKTKNARKIHSGKENPVNSVRPLKSSKTTEQSAIAPN